MEQIEKVTLRRTQLADWFTFSPERQLSRFRQEKIFNKACWDLTKSELPQHGPIAERIVPLILEVKDVQQVSIGRFILRIQVRPDRIGKAAKAILVILEEVFDTHLELIDLQATHTH